MLNRDFVKFISWMTDMGYLGDEYEFMEREEIVEERKQIRKDMEKVKEVAPKFYNLIMNVVDR